MTCWLFGHVPSQGGLLQRLYTADFTCRRCGREIEWTDMPAQVQRDVAYARRVLLRQLRDTENPIPHTPERSES